MIMSESQVQFPQELTEKVLGIIRPFHSNPSIQMNQIPVERWDHCVFGDMFILPHGFKLDEWSGPHFIATHNVQQVFSCTVDSLSEFKGEPLVKEGERMSMFVYEGKYKGHRVEFDRFSRTTVFKKEKPEELAYFVMRKYTGPDFPDESRFGLGNPYVIIVW